MNRGDVAKIAKLSGRTVLFGIRAAVEVGKVGVEVADTVLSTANDLAGEFSGHKSNMRIVGLAKKGVNYSLNQINNLAKWGDRKLR